MLAQRRDLSEVNLSEICLKVEVAESVGVTVDDGERHSRHRAGSLGRAALSEIYS